MTTYESLLKTSMDIECIEKIISQLKIVNRNLNEAYAEENYKRAITLTNYVINQMITNCENEVLNPLKEEANKLNDKFDKELRGE